MRKAPLLLAALLVVSATSMKKRRIEAPEPSPVVTPTVKPSPIPMPTGLPGNIGFKCTASCTQDERVRVSQAEIVANQVVHSECFKEFMSRLGLLDEDGNSYDASEVRDVIKDLTTTPLTVPVHYYYSSKNVVGYRNIGADDIYFNRRYHNFYNACDTASNAVHEWSHPLGYGHPFNPTSWRGRTVPYGINQAIDKCCSSSNGFRGTFEVR